jgi:cation transport regulator ChaC
MSRIAVFGYGSLADPQSAARTLGRPVEEVVPARLAGWRRRWSEARHNHRSEKTFALEPGGELPEWVLGLNVEPAPQVSAPEGPNGVLIEVSEAELERLDVREVRYARAEVTEQIGPEARHAEGAAGVERFDLVVTYTAKPEHFAPQPPPGAAILASYARTVEAAFAALGPGHLETFRETTGPPPLEPVEARLIRDEIPPGNPRQW